MAAPRLQNNKFWVPKVTISASPITIMYNNELPDTSDLAQISSEQLNNEPNILKITSHKEPVAWVRPQDIELKTLLVRQD